MGLIAFPFILCLICSPFIVGALILFYADENKKQREFDRMNTVDAMCARGYYIGKWREYSIKYDEEPPKALKDKWVTRACEKHNVTRDMVLYMNSHY